MVDSTEMQKILLGQKEILPGLDWLARHLEKFPNGKLPEQKLQVSVDDSKLRFTISTKARKGAIEQIMRGMA